MPGLDILDVVIGTVFIFLIASLLCSSVSEFISSLLHLRARELERGIGELIGDPKNSSKLLEAVYDHGLVNGLFKGTYAESKRAGALKRFFQIGYQLPSYVPAENFALALIDLVEHPPAGVTIPANVTTAVEAIGNAAVTDFEQGRRVVEGWYDSAMDRVSGWYKRRTQLMLLVIGFAVAVIANIDAIQLIQALSTNSALRQTVVAEAQAYASAPKTNEAQAADAQQAIAKYYSDLKDLNLPLCVGCRWATFPDPKDPNYDATKTIWQNTFWTALVGYVITAFAMSFGAPFWFDMLNKLIVVRSTVKPKEKSGEEKSKD